MFTTVIVHAEGASGQGDYLHILERAAAFYILNGGGRPVSFSHPACDGVLTYRHEGIYGSYGGTFFDAQFVCEKGNASWQIMFRRGAEERWSEQNTLDDTAMYVDEGMEVTHVPLSASAGTQIRFVSRN